jgi:hypothetical protein
MRCEGGVAPGSFRSLYAPIERASGGVAVQASSAAAVTRSRNESSPITLPALLFRTACVVFWPTITVLSLKRGRNRVKVAFLRIGGLSELGYRGRDAHC